MARVRLSPFITSISGKLGNAVFQRSRGGHILKSRDLGRNTYSDSRYQARSFLSSVIRSWNDLSDSDRNNWNNYVKLRHQASRNNVGVALSPYQLFLKYNLIRLHAGFSILESISFDYILEQSFSLECFVGPSGLWFNIGFNLSTNYQSVLLKVSRPIDQAARFDKSKIRVVVITGSQTTSIYFEDGYEALYGALPVYDDYIFYEITTFSNLSPSIGQVFRGTILVEEE